MNINPKILVVEDFLANRKILDQCFNMFGNCLSPTTYEGVIDAIKVEEISIVFLDESLSLFEDNKELNRSGHNVFLELKKINKKFLIVPTSNNESFEKELFRAAEDNEMITVLPKFDKENGNIRLYSQDYWRQNIESRLVNL